MNTTAKAHEPTMEEILASIRRIISDDEPASAAASEKPSGMPKFEAAPAAALGQDDIDAMLASFDPPAPAPTPALQKAHVAPPPAPAPVKAEAAKGQHIELDGDIDVFELTDEMAADDLMAGLEAELAAPPRPPEPRPQALAAPDRLVSQATDEAVGAAFGSLAHTILSNNGRTIDDLVKELLRPMLQSWLDDNLPTLVERLVRQEIERVARGR